MYDGKAKGNKKNQPGFTTPISQILDPPAKEEAPVKRPRGRPKIDPKTKITFNREWMERFLQCIMDGRTTTDLSRKEDWVPYRMQIRRWMSAYPEFKEAYDVAVKLRADILFEEIIDLSRGTTPQNSNAVKVAADNLRWVLTKSQPERYGDKIKQEHTGANGLPLTLEIIDRFDGVKISAKASNKSVDNPTDRKLVTLKK